MTRLFARVIRAAATAAILALSAAGAAAQTAEDGLFAQDWIDRAGDLPAQLQSARDQGKHLVLLWETPNCDRCGLFHQQYLADPDFASYVRDRAVIVQINRLGTAPVTGFDGAATTEGELATSFAMGGAPTLQFLKQEVAAGDIRDSEVMRQSGYREGPQHGDVLRAMFEYVAEGAYTEKFFPQWFRDR